MYVDVVNSKVKGAFGEEDINRSLEEYISQNKTALIKPLIDRINLKTGKKMYDAPTALKLVADRLRKTYFD